MIPANEKSMVQYTNRKIDIIKGLSYKLVVVRLAHII